MPAFFEDDLPKNRDNLLGRIFGDSLEGSSERDLVRTKPSRRLVLRALPPQATSRPMRDTARVLCVLLGLVIAGPVHAEDIRVAVAANFLGTLEKLAEHFKHAHGHTVVPIAGSTGQLFAQIQRGAPYDVLLSADTERPAQLEAAGLTVKSSRFTYAVGRLVLWSPKPGAVDEGGSILKRSDLRFVAIADPKVAPYGAAAEQVLSRLEMLAPLRAAGKLVIGESVGQTHQFALSGHADCAFIALAQVIDASGKIPGSAWQIPETMYAPIAQDAVLLRESKHVPVAQLFLKWLREDRVAVEVIRNSGYALPARASSPPRTVSHSADARPAQ